MESTQSGWWRRHGWTLAILLSAFGLTFAVRTIWEYPVIAQWGPLFTYAGVSDSYYHSRVMSYIILNHRNLVLDPMLRFPIGAVNPREPLFDWMNAVLGMLFAPAFGGNAVTAAAWFLDLQAPLWAALGVFPVYLIGREVSGRRMGLIAALIFPFLSANIDSSTFGYANYLTFYTFFVLVVVYAYLRTVKAVGTRRYIESYAKPSQYVPGIRAFLRTERTAVKWSVFTGVCLGALALAWQGYTYGVVVIGVGVLIAMLVERIRKVDSFGLYATTWIVGLVAFPMAAPYYFVQGDLPLFFDVPILLFFGTLAILLPFLLMRDVPWVFSIPALILFVGGAAVLLKVVFPRYFTDVITGQGYFVKNLVYSTIAEAQAPSIDSLVIGYGVITFFLAFAGIALFVFLLVRHRFKRYHIVFLVFSIVSIYLPISASKFFVIGSPAFALLSAEAVHRALDVGGYPALRRTVASLTDTRSRVVAFRKAFKARHVLVLALVVVILLPNVWISIDAGVPGNTKTAIADQVNTTIPPWLKLNASAPASGIFGAAGSALDTPNQYDSAAYNWLAQQDVNVPEPQRPAFVSWWDYGFQAIAQGEHPSVADNFQNGIDPAGQFLLSQNESLAIAILATTLLQAEQKASGLQDLPVALNSILARDGVNVTDLHNYLVNESADYALVVADPAKYLPVNPSTITDDNAMYLAVSYFLAGSLSLTAVARVYDDIQAYTGWSIRYAMADSRLFPFSGSNTGIYYAPADLTGRVINDAGLPTTFFNVTVLGSDGNTYPLGSVPANVAPQQYQINYQAPFYDSMIYRTYIGYNGTDAGLASGIPGLTGAAQSSPIEPGWMLQHFQVVYHTAYVCPGIKNATSGAGCFIATNKPAAAAIANKTNGTNDKSAVSYFQGGESMLAYYSGEPVIGTLRLSDGSPAAGVRVTVYDSWGIPHMTTVAAANGSFSMILPPGNDTLNVTSGSFDALTQSDSVLDRSLNITVPNAIGYSLDPPNLVLPLTIGAGTIQGFVYWNIANSSTFSPSTDRVIAGAKVVFSQGPNGSLSEFTALTDASGSFELAGLPPGTYNYTVVEGGQNFTQGPQNVTVGTIRNASAGLTPGAIYGTVSTGSKSTYGGALVTLTDATGVVSSTTTASNGSFALHGFGPGTYTITATVPGSTLRSSGVAVIVTNSSKPLVTVLLLESMGAASVEVLSAGTPVANVPVRFAPIVSFDGPGVTGVATILNSTSNTTLATTDSAGFAGAALPIGNYSVYALATSGGVLSTAIGTVSVAPGSEGSPTLLNLTAAYPLTGTILIPSGSPSTYRAAVIAYPASGGEVTAWASSNGSYSLLLPGGAYNLLGLEGLPSNPSADRAALASAQVSGATSVTLATSAALGAHLLVGTNVSGGFYGAIGANVTISVGPSGPSVTSISTVNATVGLKVPSNIPTSAGGYCISADAPGFEPAKLCGLSASALGSLSRLYLPLGTVPVTLTVEGLPAGTVVTVNLSGESPTAVNRSYTGGPTFSFSLPPGTYGVGARAVIGNGTLVYLPSSTLSTTIPFGAVSTHLTLLLLPEVLAKGSLHLPTSVAGANVTVSLASPALNVTVNGTAFASGFRIAPGNYTATINGTSTSASYGNVTFVNVAADGAITPTLVLNRAAVTLSGSLVEANGTSFTRSTTVTLVNAGGATIVKTARSGSFSAVLPPNSVYSVYASATTAVAGPNGSVDESWTTSPGAQCSVGPGDSTCTVTLVGTVLPAWFNGSLVRPGVAGTMPGTLRLVGPYPSLDVQVVNATNGSFSEQLVPGSYSVYAVADRGATFATFGRALVLPSSGNFTIALLPTWNAAISVVASGAASQTVGPATVTVNYAFGDFIRYPSVALGTVLNVALPLGTYFANATAAGTLHGFASNATANATIHIVSGNVGATLALGVPVQATVVGAVVGPTSATVSAGGSATFSFSVRSSGNVPVTVHPVGSPSFWSFNFSIGNVTLSPGGAAISGEVRVTVPAGTVVAHAPVAISFELSNGTSAGTVSPAPTVVVLPYYGVGIGVAPTLPVEVGSDRILLPFYVANLGNTPETVSLSVVNSYSLAAKGWAAKFTELSGPLNSSVVTEAAGSNTSYLVNLTTTETIFLPPGSVTVSATVTNVTGTYSSSVTLTVPPVALRNAGGTTFYVTGPSIGAAQSVPNEGVVAILAFAPAIVLAAGVLVYRWWRTRKWVRR
ncbi:MAG TPA: carboxypeptidase regulatory-like domain-containing protein [Thermoplasmata archaeon]|nr:carboxypeptidase regulatory-like domain-containing protein [Thermoplasmata archaeon]